MAAFWQMAGLKTPGVKLVLGGEIATLPPPPPNVHALRLGAQKAAGVDVCAVWRGLNLPFAANSLTGVYAASPFAGLWAQDELSLLMGEFWRVNAPESWLILEFLAGGLFPPKQQHGQSVFYRTSVKHALTKAGFTNLRQERLGGGFFNLTRLCRIYAQKILITPPRRLRQRAIRFQPA